MQKVTLHLDSMGLDSERGLGDPHVVGAELQKEFRGVASGFWDLVPP